MCVVLSNSLDASKNAEQTGVHLPAYYDGTGMNQITDISVRCRGLKSKWLLFKNIFEEIAQMVKGFLNPSILLAQVPLNTSQDDKCIYMRHSVWSHAREKLIQVQTQKCGVASV